MNNENDKMNPKHLVCIYCGTLLECDWMGIGLGYEDFCPKGHEGYHEQKEIDCDCEQRVITNG